MMSTPLERIDDLKISWVRLGEGSYNITEISEEPFTLGGYTGYWVRKKSKENNKLSGSNRAVDRWNQINPKYPAFLTQEGYWMVPYLGKKVVLDDNDIAKKIIDIYKEHRMIVLDAFGKGNMLYDENEPVCVDVDLACRRGSFGSEDHLRRERKNIMDYLDHPSYQEKQESIRMIRILIYFEDCLANEGIHNINLSLITPWFIEVLYGFYLQKAPITQAILDVLSVISVLDPLHEGYPHYYFTPSVLNTLSDENQPAPLTKDYLVRVMHALPWNVTWAREVASDHFFNAVQFTLGAYPSWIHETNLDGYNLLHLASIRSNLKLARVLIEKNISLDAEVPDLKMNAIQLACSSGSIEGSCIARIITHSTHSWNQNLQDCLLLFSLNSRCLSRSRRDELLDWIEQHPQVVTWVLNDAGDILLYRAFDENHREIIERLVRLPNWISLSQTKRHSDGATLLHIVAHAGHVDLLSYLEETDVNATTYISRLTPLHVAAQYNKKEVCEWLLAKGSNPMLKNKQGKIAESLWLLAQTNPFARLRLDLVAFVREEDVNLNEERKNKLHRMLIQNTHLLLWPLDQEGGTLLHLIFYCNHRLLIKTVTQNPLLWGEFVLKSQDTPFSLFAIIASRGLYEYYDVLKPWYTTQQALDAALVEASTNGHTHFCERLVLDGASPDIWCMSDERLKSLAQLKQKMNALISHAQNFNGLTDKTGCLLENLKITIREAVFDPNDTSNKTADELLNEVIVQWENNHRVEIDHAIHQWSFWFFGQKNEDQLIFELLQSMRSENSSKVLPL